MTEYEITVLCAEAMELDPHVIRNVVQRYSESGIYVVDVWGDDGFSTYDPLKDNAQAMALVKRFGLQIIARLINPFFWCVVDVNENFDAESEDLNRAICECVAKMQANRSDK